MVIGKSNLLGVAAEQPQIMTMIEAVNSALASAQVVKAEVANSAVKNYASNPEQTQAVTPAPYTSTKIRFDIDFDKAVLEFRDTFTGDVVSQTPSENQLKAYRKPTTDATIDVRDARAAQGAEVSTKDVQTVETADIEA